MSNSAALLIGTAPENCNFFRAGIALYGLWPSLYIQKNAGPTITLQPIMALKTYIQQIKNVPAGTSIGYNYLYKTIRNSRIAILPVGYADGIPSTLSNCGYMQIENQCALL